MFTSINVLGRGGRGLGSLKTKDSWKLKDEGVR